MACRICLAGILLFITLATAGIEDKYRQLKVISLGAVVITDPHITVVGPEPSTSGKERVSFLQLDRGVVHFKSPGGSGEELRAEIGQGTDRDPAANFSGVFEW